MKRTLPDKSALEKSEDDVAVDEESVSIDEVRDLVQRALFAIVVGDVDGSDDLFTQDVTGDSPYMYVRSRIGLEDQLSDRSGGLTDVDLTVDRVEEMSDGWLATWRVSGDHTGRLMLNEDVYFAPTGHRIDVSATTHLVLKGRRVRAFRTSYDEQDVAAQLRGA